MEQTVKRFELPLGSKVSLRMPLGSEALAVASEFGRLILYARIPLRFEHDEARVFHISQAGNAFSQESLRFIGSAALLNSRFFVFEAVPER